MDIQEIVGGFFQSSHGQQALGALGAQGISPEAATQFLGHATEAAAMHVHEHHESSGLLGAHPGKSFFAAFAAGLIKGDGVLGALEDGAMGVVTGRITEALMDRAGLDSDTASVVAAAATPYITSYLKEKFTT